MDSLYFCKKYKKNEYEYRTGCAEIVPILKGIHGESFIISLTEEIRGMLDSIQKLVCGIKEGDSDFIESCLIEAFNSASIEGCRSNIDNVRKILSSGDLTRCGKEDKMVLNIVDAQLKYYENKIRSISDIVDAWKVVSEGVCDNLGSQGNMFRSKMVYIGNEISVKHYAEYPDKIYEKMSLLERFINNKGYNPLLKSIISHYYIEYIHPMCDCNGRLGRLLQNAIMYQEGYEGIRFANVSETINKYLSRYYVAIESSEVAMKTLEFGKCIDVTPFVYYMAKVLLESCKGMKGVV